jgi:hypothetical protein
MTCSKGRRPTVDRPPSRPPCESALRESNPPVRFGRPVPRPLGQGHISTHRFSGRRGSRTPKAHRSPVFETGAVARRLALPTGSTEGRNRTSVSTVNNHPPVPTLAPSVSKSIAPVGAAGFEPAVSWSQARRIAKLSHTPRSAQRESNPHLRPGRTARCRYTMGTSRRRRIVKERESTGWDSNPRRRITGAGSSPLDDQCRHLDGTRGARTLTFPVKSRACCR